MTKKYKALFIFCLSLWGILLTGLLIYYSWDAAVLDPKGWIGEKERDLLVISTWLMLIVVIPVLLMTIGITWKYRASNKEAKYSPDWDKSHLAEAVWWGLPFVIIIALSVLTWKSSHDLDPFKPLDSNQKPLKIQVVALQWKWLFLYPEQGIASVNFLQIPEKTPIYFEISADAPMNSFWIPRLGGQIYAMPGMRSKLHLIAQETGDFRGSSANLSGDGFAHMHFVTRASSKEAFDQWVETVRSSPGLDWNHYTELAKPSVLQTPSQFRLAEENLFERIIMKFMMPPGQEM